MDEVTDIETSDTTKALIVAVAATAVITVVVVKVVEKVKAKRWIKKNAPELLEV